MKDRPPITFFPVLALGLLLLALLAGSFQSNSASGHPRAHAGDAVTLTPWAHLPYVSKGLAAPSATPTPTSTPAAGCSTRPTLMSPANGSALDTLIPLLQWDSGNDPNATELRLDISLDSEVMDHVYGLRSRSRAQGMNEWRINMNLDPATVHYWRAYLMCEDIQGPYSDVWSFTTGSGGTILPGPSLLSPADGSTLAGTEATLEWSSVSGAVEYWVWYSGGGWDRGRLVQDTQATLSLSPNTSYEWWVQARNDYALGNESSHWQFATGVAGR
jgi:hypothetical protein